MNVGKQIANNVMWKYLELMSVSGIQLVCTFCLARFLTAGDYGILGMVLVFTTLANVIVDSGFGQAIIREREVTCVDYSSVLYFNIAVSLILYILLYLFSGAIAAFYNEPLLNNVCKVTFLVLPLNALALVQTTKLQRELKFKKLCIISIAATILSSVIAIYVAYIYRNVWALVVMNILIYFFKMLFLWLTTDFVPVLKFSFKSLKKYYSFSKNIMLSAIIGTIFNNIYSLLIGKVYSITELGYYSQADRIKNLGSQTTTQVIQAVTYPFLSRINHDTGNIKEGYKKIISVSLIFVGTIMALLMGCSPQLFELLMGAPEWKMAGIYFLLIGINGILFPLHCVNQNILMVKGKSKTILHLEIARRAIMVVILLVTLNFDMFVFVFGLTIYSMLLLFLNLYYCGKPINYTLRDQLKDTMPIFLRLLIVISVAILAGQLAADTLLVVRVMISFATGLVVSLLLFMTHSDFRMIMNLLVSMLKHR